MVQSLLKLVSASSFILKSYFFGISMGVSFRFLNVLTLNQDSIFRYVRNMAYPSDLIIY
jgi:hypothetical protein